MDLRESAPAGLEVDGDLSEWRLTQDAAAAPSRLAVAFDSSGLVLAGQLRELARDGIWLGMSFPVPDLSQLPLGFQQSDGFVLLDCSAGGFAESQGLAALKDCREKQAARDQFVAEYRARFRRVLRIDAAGVRLAQGEELSPVDGAKAALRSHGDGSTVEVSLPPTALPRASAAPIEEIALRAVALGEPLPVEPDAHPWPALPVEAVTFEPYGSLRNALFALGQRFLSYQPGADDIEQVGYAEAINPDALKTYRSMLHDPQAKVGTVEFCYLRLDGIVLAVLDGAKVLSLTSLGREPDAAVLRGKELHLYTLQQADWIFELEPDGRPWLQMWWSVAVARPDGRVHDATIAGDLPPYWYWLDPKPFHSPRFDTFGLRGTVRAYEKLVPSEATWRLEPDGSYRVSWKHRRGK